MVKYIWRLRVYLNIIKLLIYDTPWDWAHKYKTMWPATTRLVSLLFSFRWEVLHILTIFPCLNQFDTFLFHKLARGLVYCTANDTNILHKSKSDNKIYVCKHIIIHIILCSLVITLSNVVSIPSIEHAHFINFRRSR